MLLPQVVVLTGPHYPSLPHTIIPPSSTLPLTLPSSHPYLLEFEDFLRMEGALRGHLGEKGDLLGLELLRLLCLIGHKTAITTGKQRRATHLEAVSGEGGSESREKA